MGLIGAGAMGVGIAWQIGRTPGMRLSFIIGVLRYLAEHIRTAVPRQHPTDINSSAMAYLTRGFAGGMTFAFAEGVNVVRFDFIPRVITTSAVTKTMMGQGLPTRIDKTAEPASPGELAVARAYYEEVRTIIKNQYIRKGLLQ